MAATQPDNLPRVKIPAVRVNITRQFILQQVLQALGVTTCDTATFDYESDEIVAVVSIDIPAYGSNLMTQERKFYGEPSKARDEAIESARASALLFLQTEDVVFIDDANLQELRQCQRRLLQATSWAEVFQMHCISQKAEISAMTEHARLMALVAPPSPTGDEMVHSNPPENVLLPPIEDSFTLDPLLENVFPKDQSTPPHSIVVAEDLPTAILGFSYSVDGTAPSKSGESGLVRASARRSLFSDDVAPSST